MKKCYYELLQVDQKAESDEIKKAYRKQALKWHPDKHPNNQEEATHQFRQIQEAYEILSDPQERAFYDRNRDSVMRGHGVDFDEGQIVDVMAFFTTTAFHGFGDGSGGFYQVYRDLFSELARQEHTYFDPDMGSNKIPSTTFGSSKASTSTLKEFYGYWTLFQTRMSFAWCDDWETRRATNRRVRRQMEKENKRSRDVAKREYSENVRELARFVQKRDPRWKQYQEELRAANETRTIIEARKRAEERAERVNSAVNFQEQAWMRVSEDAVEASLEGRILGDSWVPADGEDYIENDDEEQDDSETDDDDYDIVDEFYCVACEKVFKSEQQFASHERSKKHIKNLKALEKHMMAEEEYFENSLDASDTDSQPDVNDEGGLDPVDDVAETFEAAQILSENSDKDEDEITRSLRKKKNKRKQNRQQHFSLTLSGDEIDSVEPIVIVDEPPEKAQQKQSSKREKKKQPQKQESKEEEFKCNVCQEAFATRNKLFTHIKDSGHAVATSSSKSTKKKNKK